ncbi:hypothetical protein [Roseateles terrae]|uniref:Transmembrane protein n=1 Tax=Roseateles terrae TaxID=431060 RepID=A0ABR6GYB5_9BURK|nr:hypothetical protein [Roseateles terrae]MBB3197102.1 hypothetical protein [Roseateles terrae]OWQ84259.1 hypothetical protein CDN98_19990 [Roseateles terrae]
MVANEAWYSSEAGALRSASSGTWSAVSWASVLAGAAAAAALSLILLVLGTGLGLAAMSPWSGEGAQAQTIGVTGIVWLALTQLAASGLGGYLAGRLRTRWRDTHVDEVHFRDTAHGLLSWAVATLFTAALLGATISGILGAGVKAASTVAGGTVAAAGAAGAGAMSGAGRDGSGGAMMGSSRDGGMESGLRDATGFDLGYYLDAMMRRDPAATATTAGAAGSAGSTAMSSNAGSTGGTANAAGLNGANPATLRTQPDVGTAQLLPELSRLVMHAWRQGGTLSPEDQRQAGALVAQRTGLSQADAERRVNELLQRARTDAQAAETRARDAADTARKAAMQAALWMFVALLIGAFTASWLATIGGRQRDLND